MLRFPVIAAVGKRVGVFALAALLSGAITVAADTSPPPLQPLIDAAKDNAVIVPPPGIYAGPVVIRRPITLDGQGKVTIDNGGKGTVVHIKTNGATVRGLRLRNSGDQHNDIDSGITVTGDFNVIKDNVIEDCLFGINLQQASHNVVRRNRISSQPVKLGVKGDAIRLWYSTGNKIEKNVITGSRDFVVWYSADNRIADNDISGGRYGMHFMYSKYNLVEGNRFTSNLVGIFLMYSDDVVVRRNRVFNAVGAAGMGIGLKETSNVEIIENEILYNSTGIYLDVSPFQPGTTNRIYRNRIAFNDIGVLFLNDWTGNLFRDNIFASNSHHVSVSTFASARRNVWEGNYWDDYEGFDRNGDHYGDRPYRPRVYADRIWMDVRPAAFFRGTPVLSMLDFLERLAPFTRPLVMLEDKKPRISRHFTPATLKEKPRGNNEGRVLQTFGGATDATTRAGTSMKRLDPFGLDTDK